LIAAFLAACLYTTTGILTAQVVSLFTAPVIQRFRLPMAFLGLLVLHRFLQGTWFPHGISQSSLLWMSLSGIVGLAIGDVFLFASYRWIGPRLAMLLMSFAPIVAAFLAWILLGETLNLQQWAGILLAVGGIGFTVLKRSTQSQALSGKDYAIGVTFGLLAAAGQAGGVILSKQGLPGMPSALSGTLVRMGAAAAVTWLAALLLGQVPNTFQQYRANAKGLLFLLVGVFSGPMLGVWLSQVSVMQIPAGIASTLLALPPVLVLPAAGIAFKEKVPRAAVIGTIVALCGVALLFLSQG